MGGDPWHKAITSTVEHLSLFEAKWPPSLVSLCRDPYRLTLGISGRLELAGRGLGGVLWLCVERDGRAGGGLVDGVDHQFKQSEALRREP